MDFQNEIKTVLNTFSLIGIPFYQRRHFNYCVLNRVIFFCLKILLEVFFSLFSAYTLLISTLWFPFDNTFLMLTSAAMNFSLLSLRLSLVFKRSEIVHLLRDIRNFITKYQIGEYVSNKKKVTWMCYLNVAIPLVGSTIFMTLLVISHENIKENIKPDWTFLCSEDKICEESVIFLLNISYALYVYITPTSCMILFYFIHTTYECALKQILAEIHHSLCLKLSIKSLSRASEQMVEATKLHRKIESVLSFPIFLAYVMVFVNFLNLVSLNATDFACQKIQFRIAGTIMVFIWTTSTFFKMTLAGSKIVEVCDFWKIQQQEIVSHCTCMEVGRPDKLLHLMLFLNISKLDLAFTGWGMFRLEKVLILSMTEVIVSYSVLLATF